MKRVSLAIALGLVAHAAAAQNATAVSNGQSFANSIAPTSPTQIVNPSAVSGNAWANQTSTPTAVPTGLGGFSSPNTSSTLYGNAQGMGLSAMGNQAMTNCATYTPGSDPYQNQYCSAVNFLNNQCMQPTTREKSVLGSTGTAQGASANCSGTYGAGQSNFSFPDQVTSTDSMFAPIAGLGQTEAGVTQQSCSQQQVVTQPAQFANNTCVVSNDTESDSCSQQLNVTATNNTVPATLTNVGCVAPWITVYNRQTGANVGCMIIAEDSLNLQNGDVFDGLVIFHPAQTHGSYGVVYPNGWDGFNHLPPDNWGGDWDDCAGQPALLQCIKYAYQQVGLNYNADYGSATEWYSNGQGYGCPNGGTLSGSNCIQQGVSTSWSDTCGAYTGGAPLPAPAQ